MKKSPIDFYKLKPFTLKSPSLYNFIVLGEDRNLPGLTHTAYFSRPFVSLDCSVVENFTEINPNCKQFIIKNAAVSVGCLFVSRTQCTIVQPFQLEVGKMKSTKNVEVLHFLEDFGILMFKSLDSSLLAISRHVTSPIVATIKDEDLKRGL